MPTPLTQLLAFLTLVCYISGQCEASLSTNKTDSGFVLTCMYPSSTSVTKVMWQLEDLDTGDTESKFSIDVTDDMDPQIQPVNQYTCYTDSDYSQLSSDTLQDSVQGKWTCVCTILDDDFTYYDVAYESLILVSADFEEVAALQIDKYVTDEEALILNCTYGEGVYYVSWQIGNDYDDIDDILSQQSVSSSEEKIMISMPSMTITSNFYNSELELSESDKSDVGTYWCVVGDSSTGDSSVSYTSINVKSSDVSGCSSLIASNPVLVLLAVLTLRIAILHL